MNTGIHLIFLIFCVTFLQEILTLSEEHIENSLDPHIRKKRVIDKTPGGNQPQIHLNVPYIVHIHKNGTALCGGSILLSSVILTAAHCVSDQAVYTVLSGSVHVNIGILRHNVTGKLIHHMYNLATRENDIALLHISPNIDLIHSRNRRIELYQGNVPDHTLGIISGWGCIDESGPVRIHPTQLQSIVLPIFNHERCLFLQGHYAPVISDKNICTYDIHVKKCASSGDHGGPLVVDDKLFGVLSWTGTRQHPDNPDVFIKVSHPLIRNWIVSNTQIVEEWL